MIYILSVYILDPFSDAYVMINEKAFDDKRKAEEIGRGVMVRNHDVKCKVRVFKEVSN